MTLLFCRGKDKFVLDVNPRHADISDSPIKQTDEGILGDSTLLRVILRPTKVLSTCQKSGPYSENSPRCQDLKILI